MGSNPTLSATTLLVQEYSNARVNRYLAALRREWTPTYLSGMDGEPAAGADWTECGTARHLRHNYRKDHRGVTAPLPQFS